MTDVSLTTEEPWELEMKRRYEKDTAVVKTALITAGVCMTIATGGMTGTVMNRRMNSNRYRLSLQEFGLAHDEAGWIFGGKSRKSGRDWLARGAPYHVALLLEVMRKYKIPAIEIRKLGEPYRSTY